MPKALVVAMGLGLGTMTLVSLSNPTRVHASDDVQTINVNHAGEAFSFWDGTDQNPKGMHAVTYIRDDQWRPIFCVEWKKPAPGADKDGHPLGNDQLSEMSDSQLHDQLIEAFNSRGEVQWLVTDYNKGNGHRFVKMTNHMGSNKQDEADYWLYQMVIHKLANPGDADATEDGNDHGVQYTVDHMGETERNLYNKLLNEAQKHRGDSTREIIQDTHSLSYDPSSLTINGKDDLKGNEYQKDFTFHKTENMANVSVELKDNPQGVQLEGANGGVDFHNVWDNTKLRIKAPYKINADKDEYKFTVHAEGTWNAKAKVAAIFAKNTQHHAGDGKQAVAGQVIKAVPVEHQGSIDMPVTVKPAKGSVEFTKKGTGSNGNDVLANTEFTLTGGNVKQVKKTDGNGYVKFDNLPLGQDYKLDETGQPNKRYLPDYHTTITSLNSDPLSLNENLNNIINDAHYTSIRGTKKDANGKILSGAKFVLVRSDQGSPKMSIDDAKKNALRQVDDGRGGKELVEGHGDQQPFVATADNDGNFSFNQILLPSDRQIHKYYAVEVEAPKGYTLSQDSLAFNVSEKSPDTVTGELKDSTMPLPATGSEKLLVVTVAGVVLAVIAGGVVYFNRKKAH